MSKCTIFQIKSMQPIQVFLKRNYRVLTFPLHEGICRDTVLKPCQTQNNNNQISFLYNFKISEYTHTLRIKRVPSSTMDVRGANTFPLYNRLPIPIFGRRPSYPFLWGFIYISPFLLEQIKLGGDFTVFEK